MDKLRRALNGNERCDEESGIITQVMDQTTLSWSTRIKERPCCICCVLYFRQHYFFSQVKCKITCFLMGPFNQFKKMFASTRIIATILVFVSIGLTLFAALHLHNPGLALLFIIIQSLAMTWYSLSYIPYARDAVKKTVEACIT
ncbi:vesicle transport protein SFT2A isoform X4 [Monomorium pharaonis]|uniref:vesicle transport protein SFT2A isoform X4 n=1 Tax=Monomorium pharaonis TaxID=307658 RepID=UPI001746E2DB|nr:vesicle transport protein SFT2A isoform X4 [Monomorium pharaonis]